VSPDPLLATVPGLDEALGDNLNLYAYAGNNPVRRIDLTGFEGENFSDRLKRVTEFWKGLAQGGAEATVPGGMIAAAASPNPRGENAAAFAQGRAAGQIIGGVVSIFSGGQTIVGSAGLEVGSGGTATAVVVATGALATAQVANGTAAIASGIKGSQTSAATGEPPAGSSPPKLLPQSAGPTGEITTGEVAGKTPAEIAARANQLGLQGKGPDPASGRGAYVDPQTGQQRILSHPNASSPHGHVNNPAGARIGHGGEVVAPESPAAHIPTKKQ
jgi:hypothetical protein